MKYRIPKSNRVLDVTEEAVRQLAKLVDEHGYITIGSSGKTKYMLRLYINGDDLAWIGETIQVGWLHGTVWVVEGLRAWSVLDLVRPYLTKQYAQATIGMKFRELPRWASDKLRQQYVDALKEANTRWNRNS